MEKHNGKVVSAAGERVWCFHVSPQLGFSLGTPVFFPQSKVNR